MILIGVALHNPGFHYSCKHRLILIDDFDNNSIAQHGFFHYSHRHPLILIHDFNINAAPVVCCICQTPILGLSPAYICFLEHTPCSFFLHQRCAESPERIINLMHPQHQLHLCNGNFYIRKNKGNRSLEEWYH